MHKKEEEFNNSSKKKHKSTRKIRKKVRGVKANLYESFVGKYAEI